MPESNYFDFDLLIDRRSTGYRATVLGSPAGEANVDFNSPFTDSELKIFLLQLGGRRILRGRGSRELEAAAKNFGTRLFDAVFQGEVRGCFRSSLDQIERQRGALRLRLRFADAPELADLPWEYLYYTSRRRFLAISAESPIVRYLDLPEPITPLVVNPPLRILTMISSPIGYPELDVEREFTNLHKAIGELEALSVVVLERMEKPTLSALQRQLRRGDYHVFHFIGHGAFDPQSDEGVLVLENEQGHPRLVTGGILGAVLHNKRSLRLAVLNSCEGARGSLSDPYAGTAQNLVQQGIPAVIAMQFEISDQAAIIFAHEFYSALADGFPVDAALTEARLRIFSEGNETEWATPVLYLRSPDGRIFQVNKISEAERKKAQRDALIAEAEAALAAGEFDIAEEKLTQVLNIDPSDITAKSRLDSLHLKKEAAERDEGTKVTAQEDAKPTQALPSTLAQEAIESPVTVAPSETYPSAGPLSVHEESRVQKNWALLGGGLAVALFVALILVALFWKGSEEVRPTLPAQESPPPLLPQASQEPSTQSQTGEASIDFFYAALGGGSWFEVTGYGFCFQPEVASGDSNWRPYADGYWAYTDEGWTWVSYEDFGWATYHYGRWAKVEDYGWVWFPGSDSYWGPAWVSWRIGSGYIGWAPLPPRRGVVYEGQPIGPNVDIEFDIGPAYYNFCEVRYMGEPVLRSYIVPPAQNVTYINNTVNVTNITVQNNIVYNYGPDYSVISAYSKRPILRLTIERQSAVNLLAAAKTGRLSKVQGNKFFAAPSKLTNLPRGATPPIARAKIPLMKINRGWADVPNEGQLKKKIKSENPKNIPPPIGK